MNVEICKNCEGMGESVFFGDARFEDSETRQCPFCNGTGRVMIKKFTISTPFDSDRHEFHKTTDEITRIIHSFKNRKNEA